MAVDPATVAEIIVEALSEEKCRNILKKYRSSHFCVV